MTGAGADGPGRPWTPGVLTAIRGRRRWRLSALLVATLVGFGVAWVHWLGLFVAGGLLGLAARTPGRAVLSGAIFGSLVVVGQVLLVPDMTVIEFLALRPPVYVTLGLGVGAPVWGSLVRGVV